MVISSARASDRSSFEERQVVIEDPTMNHEKKDAVEVEAVRSRLLTVAPQKFEYLVKNVLLRTGFERVHVTNV
jgi:hypothetical protein